MSDYYTSPKGLFEKANSESRLAYYLFDLHPDWSIVAALDESWGYEVDTVEIWRTPTGFAVVRASGCSGWDGSYEAAEYPTLDQAIANLLDPTDRHQYNPSVRGAAELTAKAQEAVNAVNP